MFEWRTTSAELIKYSYVYLLGEKSFFLDLNLSVYKRVHEKLTV
jgi:hypothetical protein